MENATLYAFQFDGLLRDSSNMCQKILFVCKRLQKSILVPEMHPFERSRYTINMPTRMPALINFWIRWQETIRDDEWQDFTLRFFVF